MSDAMATHWKGEAGRWKQRAEAAEAEVKNLTHDIGEALKTVALEVEARAAAEAKLEEWKAMALAYQLDKEEAEAEVRHLTDNALGRAYRAMKAERDDAEAQVRELREALARGKEGK